MNFLPVRCVKFHEIAILMGHMADLLGHLRIVMTYNEINHRLLSGRYHDSPNSMSTRRSSYGKCYRPV